VAVPRTWFAQTYVTDLDAYLQVRHRVWLDFFGDELPASTLVEVSRLADPRALVEVEAYAVLD
jgi:2-iminobutanoate/2-iminopropanoate deaminase